jgi:pilus assembly protein Flp/PilA
VSLAVQEAVMVGRGCGWRRYVGDERAVTALEYALIGSLIVLAIIGALASLGSNVQTAYNTLATSL